MRADTHQRRAIAWGSAVSAMGKASDRDGVSDAGSGVTNGELRQAPAVEGGSAAVPATPAEARHHVRAALLAAGLTPETARVPWADAMLVTSELVTNAVRHGGGLRGFSARMAADELTLWISDHSDDFPSARDPGRSAQPGGYGFPLVTQLCLSVAMERNPHGGKTVIAVIRLSADSA